MDLDQLRFPIGKFKPAPSYTAADLQEKIKLLATAPAQLRDLVAPLTEAQLQLHYRPGGWTVRQVVHHLADSHINSYMRFKLALTEDNPTIKPYHEELWAELPDQSAPVQWSLDFLVLLHQKWVYLMQHMDAAQWQRTFYHPASKATIPLDRTADLYVWHSQHHLAHVKQALGNE